MDKGTLLMKAKRFDKVKRIKRSLERIEESLKAEITTAIKESGTSLKGNGLFDKIIIDDDNLKGTLSEMIRESMVSIDEVAKVFGLDALVNNNLISKSRYYKLSILFKDKDSAKKSLT